MEHPVYVLTVHTILQSEHTHTHTHTHTAPQIE
jgi:hypothetical protein